jgi:hypothetical protein
MQVGIQINKLIIALWCDWDREDKFSLAIFEIRLGEIAIFDIGFLGFGLVIYKCKH